ncbi:unnamed protein product [Paramecium pentaurelia]|uniref:Transmembrane protein n=1 Tax=Paramecium pentaurelia TaxID=43138 RepID=A0A8S1WFB6_9CILI|nr:unnamed protein product [Paramecium pentaurelia]
MLFPVGLQEELAQSQQLDSKLVVLQQPHPLFLNYIYIGLLLLILELQLSHSKHGRFNNQKLVQVKGKYNTKLTIIQKIQQMVQYHQLASNILLIVLPLKQMQIFYMFLGNYQLISLIALRGYDINNVANIRLKYTMLH